MKFLIATIILVLTSMVGGAASTDPVELEGLNNPSDITITSDDIYITDGITINVFSSKDYSRKVSFGKSGSGPGEFQSGRGRGGSTGAISVYPVKDKILIFNSRRHLFFSKDGKYIKEKNIGKRTSALSPFDGGYLGTLSGRDGNKFVMKFLWFDENYKAGTPILVTEIDAGRRFNVFGRNSLYTTIGKRIYLVDQKMSRITVYDRNSAKLDEIKIDSSRRDLTSTDAKSIKEYFKETFGAERYKRVSRFLVMPEKYPAFMRVDSDEKNLYLISWSLENDKNIVFVYGKDGRFVKKGLVKIEMSTVVAPYPIDIYDGSIYQLVENDDTEEWELHTIKLI